MKKIAIIILAATALLTGCKKEKGGISEGTGRLSLELTGGDLVYDIVTKSEADITAVDVNSFSVTLDGLNGQYHQEWAKYSEMPPVLELSSGDYTITATSPKTTDSQWGEPIFGGTKSFNLSVGETETVELVCTVTNVKVSISLSESFTKEIPEYEITVSENTENGKSLTWKNDDVTSGQVAYFSPVDMVVKVKGYRWDNEDGSPSIATSTANITGVEPANHYILNITAKTTGKSSVELSIDPTMDDQTENIDIPGLIETPVEGGDDPVEDPEPDEPETSAITMEWPANTSFEPIVIGEKNVDLTIKAPAGIETFIVYVSDNFKDAIAILTDAGFLDLINDEKVITALSAMDENMPLGDKLRNQTSVDFSLTSLVNLISTVGNPGESYDFTLELSDANDVQFTKTLTFINQ